MLMAIRCHYRIRGRSIAVLAQSQATPCRAIPSRGRCRALYSDHGWNGRRHTGRLKYGNRDNAQPTVSSATLSPTTATTEDDLYYCGSTNDRWRHRHVVVRMAGQQRRQVNNERDTTPHEIQKGDQRDITPNDGTDGAVVRSSAVVVSNSPLHHECEHWSGSLQTDTIVCRPVTSTWTVIL